MRSFGLLGTLFLSLVLCAQTPQTVSLGVGYTGQVWYSLQSGAQTSAPVNDWDLAFEIQGFTASVLANTQKPGLSLYRAPYAIAQWNVVDTTGVSGWRVLQNSDTSWSHGAFNQGLTTDEFDLGWGVYNMITHVVAGDSLFVIKLANGTWRKLRIDALAGGVFTFTHANIDGSDEQTGAINKVDYAGKNFAYWSIESNTALDREPLSADWDLTFCRYITFIPEAYGVTGGLHNKGVVTARVAELPPADAVWTDAGFSSHINTIGYDWKTFDMGTFTYVIDDSLSYFVKDVPGNIWKVVFTGFGGATNGNIEFTKELVSSADVQEAHGGPGTLVVYPNPASGGHVQVLLDLPMNEATLTVLDVSGRQVIATRWTGLGALSVRELELSGLPAGSYAVRVDHAGGSLVARVLVD